MFVLTGSQALQFWQGKDFSDKSDYDIICSEEDLNSIGLSFNGKDQILKDGVEYISDKLLNNERMSGYYSAYIKLRKTDTYVKVMDTTGLYICKRSHLHRPIKFARHIMQFQEIRALNPYLNDLDREVLINRTKLTKEKFGDRTPKLNKTNDEFFDDFVSKYYIHDELHEIMAFGDQPVYEKLKHNPDLATCEKSLWLKLTYEEKNNCVTEEARVIALERFIIPKLILGQAHMPPTFAFDKSLEKICTTLTSGYFRDWAIDHWSQIRNNQGDYLKIFENKKHVLTA